MYFLRCNSVYHPEIPEIICRNSDFSVAFHPLQKSNGLSFCIDSGEGFIQIRTHNGRLAGINVETPRFLDTVSYKLTPYENMVPGLPLLFLEYIGKHILISRIDSDFIVEKKVHFTKTKFEIEASWGTAERVYQCGNLNVMVDSENWLSGIRFFYSI